LGREHPDGWLRQLVLPAALAVEARLTAASGRAPIYPARACDTFLTAERLDPGGESAAGLRR